MPHWLIKSAIHRVISVLPGSRGCNEWVKEHLTRSLEFSAGAFEVRLDFCRRYLDDFFELRPDCAPGFTALELGTGWHPTVPIGLWLCGANGVWTLDLQPLLNHARLRALLDYFCEYDRAGKLQKFLPRLRPERLARLRAAAAQSERTTPEALLEKLDIHALVRDAQNTGLPSGSIDLFFSCAVLEYVPAAAQEKIYQEFRRLATPSAAVIHFIDLKDQFMAFDRSLTPLNFLQYSPAAWHWLDSPLVRQTRLRISDYRALLNRAGFEIFKEDCRSAAPEILKNLHLAPEFKKYNRADLLVTEAWLVAGVAKS